MKNLFIALSVCSLCMTAACNNELESVIAEGNTELQTKSISFDTAYRVVDYNGTACLQFSNDSTYINVMNELNELSEEDAERMFSNLSFDTQQQIMKEADKEQEAIVDGYEKDLAQPFPEQQIEDFKKKYQDVFMFNPYDQTDFVANYKIKNTLHRFFVNRAGFFMIGDSVVYTPKYTSEELFGTGVEIYGSNETTDLNSKNKAESKYQIPGGDYVKVRAIWTYSDGQADGLTYKLIYVDYLSQKKKVLWKKHHATIMLRFTAKGGGHGLEVFTEQQQYVNRDGLTTMAYTQVYNKLTMFLGRFGKTTWGAYVVNGNMEIWSNEIPEINKGLATIVYPE